MFSEGDNLKNFLKIFSEIKSTTIDRIYIGSSFCSQYYLNFYGYEQVFKFCCENHINITLTIPVFSEKDLSAGKKKTEKIIKSALGIIDEITVNDIGMLSYVQKEQKYRINLGRLFFKDPRDCRVPDFRKQTLSPMLLSHLSNDYWSKFDFNIVELDPTNTVIDTSSINDIDINIGLHLPYCYMTTGNICKFASIHRDIKNKFRPNMKCAMECLHIHDTYSGLVKPTNCVPVLFRFGRTLYFEAEQVNLTGKSASRIIYFPIKEWREFVNENLNSIM